MTRIFKTVIIIISVIFLTLGAKDSAAQIVDTLDIMKEFDEFSFRGANPVNPIKDSTKIREHLIGVKGGVGINSIIFSQDIDTKAYLSSKNFGIYYTYYHSLWNSIPLFGIETGIHYSEIGFTAVRYLDPEGTPNRRSEEGKERFQTIMLPFVSQFRIDFWRMRLLLNLALSLLFCISIESSASSGRPWKHTCLCWKLPKKTWKTKRKELTMKTSIHLSLQIRKISLRRMTCS